MLLHGSLSLNNCAFIYLASLGTEITIKRKGRHKRNKIVTASMLTVITGKLFLKYELFDIHKDDSLGKYHFYEFSIPGSNGFSSNITTSNQFIMLLYLSRYK